MTLFFILACVLVLAINALVHFDTDAGGYDRWTVYPKKQAIHLAAAFVIALGAMALGVPALSAAVITAVAGFFFEITQGFINPIDVLADVLGAGAAGTLWYFLGL